VFNPGSGPVFQHADVEKRDLTPPSTSRHVGDAVDFDPQSFSRQTRGLDRGARRTMIAEHARIDAVHLLKFLHVDQEDAAADDVLQIGSTGLQDRLQVLQALRSLGLDVGAGQLSGRGIGGTLT